MTHKLPENPSLEYLKGQAKRLHKALLSEDEAAWRRVREAHPRFLSNVIGKPKLADTQLALAREYGFSSWPALKEYVAVRDPAILQEAFETVKDGWIAPEDVPGDPDRLRRLLREFPGLVHARIGKRGYTLLHFAAYRNYVEIAKILLGAGADPHARANGGATPLAVGLTYPAPDVARLLASYGVLPKNLRIAAGLGDMEMLRSFFAVDGSLLPEGGADREDWAASYDFAARTLSDDPRDILAEGLIYATQNGQLEAAEFLVERGAEVKRFAFLAPALHWVALYNQREAADFLLAHGADLMARDQEFNSTAAGWADYFGNWEMAHYLIDRGMEISIEEAIWLRHMGRVEALLENGSGLLTVRDRDGGTLLHRAARSRADLETLRLLVARGLEVNARSEKGTALDVAFEFGHLETAEALQSLGGRLAVELR